MYRSKSVLARVAVVLLVISLGPVPGRMQSLSDDKKLFRFQNNVWVTLHHFVRAESRRRSLGSPVVLPISGVSERERVAWIKALYAYTGLAGLSLIFDRRLVRINNALAMETNTESLPLAIVEPEIVAALNAAAPIYRAHLWDRHRRENEQWIAEFVPLVKQHAAAVTKALAVAYHVGWPGAPILVDLSCESGPNLAYTTDGPPGAAGHTVIAPLQAADRDVAVESICHGA